MKAVTHPIPTAIARLQGAGKTAVALLLAFVGTLLALPAHAELNSQEQAIFNYMRSAGGQRRPFLVVDPILSKVARQKAADMAHRRYFAHTDPSGFGANYLVRAQGYTLPAGYSTAPSGNNIESLSAGRDTAARTWNDWMGSAGHKRHLLGEDPFYAAQTSVGIGFVNVPGSPWQWYWVVISAPPSGPQLAIGAPANNQKVYEGTVTVNGTTDGEPAAAAVRVRAEAGGSTGAWMKAAGTATWSATVNGLTAGNNTLRVQSLDGKGAVLREVTRNVRYAVMAPVTVNVVGSGTVTNGYVGTTMREVGVARTITATPKAGHLFAGWTGAATGVQRTVTFTPVLEGTTLTANFIPNPFLGGAGAYGTIFTTGDGTLGKLNVTLNANGVFSGTIRLNGQTIAVKGRFDVNGYATLTVKKGGETYTVVLNYRDNDGKGVITGSIAGSDWSADLPFESLVKNGETPDPNAGRYTLVMTIPQAADGVPTGDGAATVVVNRNGVATVSGALADGRAFSFRSRLTTRGTLQLFVAPYAAKGLLAGTLNFRDETFSDLAGHLIWDCPVRKNAVRFAEGFQVDLAAVGSRYIAPKAGESVVPVSNSVENTALALGDGGLEDPVVQPATLSPTNALVISERTVTGLTATLNRVNGIFTGKFVHPITGERANFRGAILQKQGAGFGFFAGGTQAGYATFTPAGSTANLTAE